MFVDTGGFLRGGLLQTVARNDAGCDVSRPHETGASRSQTETTARLPKSEMGVV